MLPRCRAAAEVAIRKVGLRRVKLLGPWPPPSLMITVTLPADAKGGGFVCTDGLLVKEVHAGKFAEAAGVQLGMQLVSFNAAKLTPPADNWGTVKQSVRATPKPWEFCFEAPAPGSAPPLPPPRPTWTGPPGISATQQKWDTAAPQPAPEAAAQSAQTAPGDLAKEEGEKLEDLRRQMAEDLQSPGGLALSKVLRGEDVVLLRFLRGTAFSVPHARKVLERMLTWRSEQKINELLTDVDTVELCQRSEPFFTAGFHGHTADGQVLEIWRLDQIWPAEVLEKFTASDLELIWFSHLERGLQAQGAVADELGLSGAAGSILVVDLIGFGTRHLGPVALRTISALFATAQKMYVENIVKIWIVNAPSAFAMAWEVLKKVLHPNTVAKVELTSGSNATKLIEMMGSPTALPDFLGGTDTSCTVGHAKPPPSEWVTIPAGGVTDETIRVEMEGPDGVEIEEKRKVVVSFWTQDYAGLFSVDVRPVDGFDGPGQYETLLPAASYISHVRVQVVEVVVPTDKATSLTTAFDVRLRWDNRSAWMTSVGLWHTQVVATAAADNDWID